MNRKHALGKICAHSWKWFDLSNGKWMAYEAENNKTIDEAFWAGEPSVRINNRRRKYTIWFGNMMQANEETGNRRPVMISLLDTKKNKSSSKDKTDPPTNNPSQSANKPMPSLATAAPPPATTAASSGSSTTSSSAMSVEGGPEQSRITLPSGKGLGSEDRSSLLASCVSFLSVPVDADALNAVLRLCLRFTQDFRYAVEFAKLGGIKYILNLTQASTFNGFSSIVALLIRHVMEDPATLRLTLEKVVRGSTVQSNQYSTKELHYLLRMLAPAACRAPQVCHQISAVHAAWAQAIKY